MKHGTRIAMGLLAGSMLGIGLALLRNSDRQVHADNSADDSDFRMDMQKEITLGEILDSAEEPAI